MKALITVGYQTIAVSGLDTKALEAITKGHVVDYDYNAACWRIQDKAIEIKLVDDQQVQAKPAVQQGELA